MDISKLQTLATKLANYNGSSDYWNVMQSYNYLGRMFEVDALYSWNADRKYPVTDADYDNLANIIVERLHPMLEHMGDLQFQFDNFPRFEHHSTTDTDPTVFDFNVDGELLDEVYKAYDSAAYSSINVSLMESLNVFLKELASYPDLTHLAESPEKAANLYTLSDLQFRAKNTTVISDIEKLVAIGGENNAPLAGANPTKELGAIRLCRDLVVRKHYAAWRESLHTIFDALGDIDRLRSYEVLSPSGFVRKDKVQDFIRACSASMSNHVTHPVSSTNFSEHVLGQHDLTLVDIAHYTSELITKMIDGGGLAAQSDLIASIRKNLSLSSVTQLANIATILNLDVYDNSATIGHFVPNGSYATLEELKDIWTYVDDNSGKAE